MSQYLGNYQPGSTVQVFTNFETSFGSPIVPDNPKYEIFKLNSITGSYDIAQTIRALTVNGSGFYYDTYDTTGGTDGRFLVMYSGSLRSIPYSDFDTFDLITPVAGSGGGGTTTTNTYGGGFGLSNDEYIMFKSLLGAIKEFKFKDMTKQLVIVEENLGKQFEKAFDQLNENVNNLDNKEELEIIVADVGSIKENVVSISQEFPVDLTEVFNKLETLEISINENFDRKFISLREELNNTWATIENDYLKQLMGNVIAHNKEINEVKSRVEGNTTHLLETFSDFNDKIKSFKEVNFGFDESFESIKQQIMEEQSKYSKEITTFVSTMGDNTIKKVDNKFNELDEKLMLFSENHSSLLDDMVILDEKINGIIGTQEKIIEKTNQDKTKKTEALLKDIKNELENSINFVDEFNQVKDNISNFSEKTRLFFKDYERELHNGFATLVERQDIMQFQDIFVDQLESLNNKLEGLNNAQSELFMTNDKTSERLNELSDKQRKIFKKQEDSEDSSQYEMLNKDGK